MRKVLFILLAMVLGVSAMAQQRIQLRSVDKAECVRSDMRGLKASFSFSTIEAQKVATQRGDFSWLSLENTVLGGNVGDPQIPVVNELIAVPFGATPSIRVTSFSTTDYRLEDYDINTLMPRQPSMRKDQHPEDVPFVYNANAYQTRGLRSAPNASVYVDGIMRGIQVGKMTVEPVSYDPVSNILRVFNDIEVEVTFDRADTRATEDELVRTYTPYFDIVYAQLFNGRMLRDVYSQHPDLYTTPVKMIVITTSTYANNTTFQNWVKWKKQKGIYTTVYTTSTTGTSSSSIKSFIRNQYNSDAPTFVVIVGDTGDVTYSLSSSTTSKVTDLYYSSTTDSDLYPEMFLSRMPISSSTELTNLLNKIMTYEQYTMSNPSYLDESLLIAGWDDSWTAIVGKPTIQYANNYYFNTAHGITPRVFLTTGSGQTTCYNYINQVGFVNYTAHGDNTMWYDPQFKVSNVSSMTNNGKYFWAMGNCCLAANWGYSSTCFAEALLRAANKGAFGYIGSCPETYWYEDYYFGVGATSITNQMPTQAQTKTGCYDAMFDDTGFNTLNAVPFIGNLAVAYAHAGSYSSSVSDKYYWEAYHCLGDGSVMPYHKNPSANNVSHANMLPLGATTFTVNADAGSYVGITVNDEIIGVAQVPSSGTVNVSITPQTTAGATAHIVVTRNQRQPYMADIMITGTQYDIAATASPTLGGTVTGAGTYYEGTECTLTATPNTGYTFTNWKKGSTVVSTESSYTFTVSSSTAGSYTATFTAIPQYTIGASASPAAGGTVTGGGIYYENTDCTLKATANAHYEFTSWKKGNSVVSTSPTYIFTVTANGNYVANFTALSPHTVSCMEVEHGSISASPTTAYKNETVTLTATPETGYFFSSWDVRDAGNHSITVTDNKFTMPDSDVTVSATFVVGYNVTLATPMNGSIGASPMGGPAGTTITLTATPETGYILNSWVVYKTGDLDTRVTVSNNTFTMPSYDVTVVGIFTEPEGGDVTIGSGSSTNNGNSVPTSVYYNYSLTQQIYTSAELGEAANIIAVSFYYNNATASDERSLQVYMSHTSSSTITSWSTVSASQLVYSGTHAFTQGWNTLTLTTPFAYDGTSNVLLTVDDNSGTTITNGYFRTYSTGANRAIYYRNQNTNPDPTGSVSVTANKTKYNAQMKVTKEIPSSEGYLSVSPSSLTGFEAVGGGASSESQSVAVIGANLQGAVTVTPPAGYEVSATSAGTYAGTLTLTPSEGSVIQTVYVRLASNLDAGDYSGTMTVVSGTATATVSLSGTVVPGGTQYAITAIANPTEGGTVSGAGTYYEDNECTLVATAATGYSFANWTKGGVEVSTESSYTFTVIEDAEYVANFTLNSYEVTATANPTEGGTVSGSGTYNHGATCTLTATPAARYSFVNWTNGGAVVSTEATYVFTVTGDVALEANFEIPSVESTVTLGSGWSWWSANQEITLSQLEGAIGANGLNIVSNTGMDTYEDGNWEGNLDGIDLSKMYKIEMAEEHELMLNAPAADPTEHVITITKGVNWIGYPVQQEMNVGDALTNLTPANGDVIKTLGNSSMYGAGRWTGSLKKLEPGKGYIYVSKSEDGKEFTYPSGTRGLSTLENNITTEVNLWRPSMREFRDNMSVVAKVAIAEVMSQGEETEVGAFVGKECRGSAKLTYVEETGEYVAILLVYGHEGESVTFRVYNEGSTYEAEESVEMRSDEVVGDLTSPLTLHSASTVSLFPNPVRSGELVRVEVPAGVDLQGARVEVYNALGAKLSDETLTEVDAEFTAMRVSGIYTVKVTDRKGNVHYGKLIVR